MTLPNTYFFFIHGGPCRSIFNLFPAFVSAYRTNILMSERLCLAGGTISDDNDFLTMAKKGVCAGPGCLPLPPLSGLIARRYSHKLVHTEIPAKRVRERE